MRFHLSNYQISKLPKKKHMVTVLYMHHQAATYLAKQLAFSMGTGDSLELSVAGAPENSATRLGRMARWG